MKTCPVCHAQSFDDMSICYNCLHQFKCEYGSEESEIEIDEGEKICESVQQKIKNLVIPEIPRMQAASISSHAESEVIKKLQAEYRITISLEPVVHMNEVDSPLKGVHAKAIPS